VTFGITLLVLFFPVVLVINLVLAAVLPQVVLQTPFLPKLLVLAIFGALAFGLAVYFRDEMGHRLLTRWQEIDALKDPSANSGLLPTQSAAFPPSKLCHHGVADRAAEPWSVGQRKPRENGTTIVRITEE
jgi:hypothetical protein